MALQFVRTYLCCGCLSDADDARAKDGGAYHPGLPDETTLLIPPSIEPSISYTDVAYLHQQRMQQRLGTIVRAKEGKMVNINSQIPFNLHNQPLPSDHTISRSNSGSLSYSSHQNPHSNPHSAYTPTNPSHPQSHSPYTPRRPSHSQSHHHHNNTHHSNNAPHNTWGPSPLSLSRSPSPSRSHSHSHSHSRHSRSPSNSSSLEDEDRSRERERRRAGEQPRPSPILNVRLVGYAPAGAVARGRARERGRKGVSGKVDKGGGVKSVTDEGEGGDGQGAEGKGAEEGGMGGGQEGGEGGEAKGVAVKKKKKAAFMFDEDVEGIAISWGD
ncbi:hypothetical protein DFP72DRAFT_1048103 [Ephemerocybe angulata]|uniref:Uncharacterized protein n=1 Tax=Ephemerocybe angulata TaxID=980116 RepID=A0A8H6M4C4_9AGAR|nr:hypothetical protein DFP72DRAFT_1048103 [Tulosesus angulatus]